MPDMTTEEAFAILDLPKDASEKEIKKSYHNKSLKYHSDKNDGGEDETQKKLNIAREIADAYSKDNLLLVPIKDKGVLIRFEQELAVQRAISNSRESVITIKNQTTRPLAKINHIMWVCCGIAGFLALFEKNILPFLNTEASVGSYNSLKALLTLLTFMFGSCAAYLKWMIEGIKNKIDIYSENLSDYLFCSQELARALSYSDCETIRKDEIHCYQKGFLNPFIHLSRITEIELHPLLLNKSIEHGLLLTNSNIQMSQRGHVTYDVNFKPSEYKPEIIEKEPPKPTTAWEDMNTAKEMFIACFFISLVTFYLGFFKHSKWSIAPGLLAALLLMISIATLVGSLQKRKKERHDNITKSESEKLESLESPTE